MAEEIKRFIPCKRCKGTGIDPLNNSVCELCGGTGKEKVESEEKSE